MKFRTLKTLQLVSIVTLSSGVGHLFIESRRLLSQIELLPKKDTSRPSSDRFTF